MYQCSVSRSSMRLLCLYVVLLIFVICFAADMKQEGAVVRKCNPKYVTDCYSITRRLGRRTPYRSNLTTTTKHPWGNNVTLTVAIQNSGFLIEVVRTKICEVKNTKWLYDYAREYSNMSENCPHKPGHYGFYNMVFPPKNIPQKIQSLLRGRVIVVFQFIVTKTEEKIIEVSMTIYDDQF